MNGIKNEINNIKKTILIVEDNLLNRELLKEILLDKYNVIEAFDGLDGLEKLNESYIDISLILLDVEMPRMTGYEFLDAIKDNAKFNSIPIIVTTSQDTAEEERCLELGSTDFVRKPYMPSILLKRINGLIKLKESTSLVELTKYDQLTGLYTKNIFNVYANNLLKHDKNIQFGIFLVEIEDLSGLNNFYGQHYTDQFLKHIANSIVKLNSNNDLLFARQSHDKFVVMYNNKEYDALILINKLDTIIKDSTYKKFDKVKYAYIDVLDPVEDVQIITNKLLFALHEINHQYHKNIIKYESSILDKANKLKSIEECMEASLANKEFKVYYQPKMDPYTNKIVGAEALVRWIHPTLGFISPGDFIPVFETNGFILNLDIYVWNRVVEDITRWKAQGLPIVPISINASRRDFIIDSNYGEFIQGISEKDYLHLELTESACSDSELVFPIVNNIRNNGMTIEIDDFGSGYSSLGMLKELPMDILKLDISFSRSIEKQKEVVETIINLAHKLNAKTVAEGVETIEQLNILKELKCDYIQGYYYSKPLPENEYVEFLIKNA